MIIVSNKTREKPQCEVIIYEVVVKATGTFTPPKEPAKEPDDPSQN